MSTLENREKALHFAAAMFAASPGNGSEWTTNANNALNFLETGSFAPQAAPPANPPAAESATRKPRATKSTPANTAEGSESAPAAAGSAPNTSPAPGAAQPAEPTKAAGTPAKAPTLDDVRNALVQCQTRKGGKDVPQAILNKYSPSKTTGGLPQDKYATVIAECAAA